LDSEKSTTAAIKELMIRKISGSGISLKDAKLLELEPVSAHTAKIRGFPGNAAGFLIPYFDILGKRTKFERIRYLEDTRHGFDKISKKKPLRYGQRPNTINELYLPPLVDWDRISIRTEIPLLITEGELKSACATKLGLPTIGLGGVWCFQSASTGNELLPGFDAFAFADRTIYIIFDSDAATNPNILAAEERLSKRLTERGAVVHLCRLPAYGAGDTQKVGLDDYLMLHSAEELQEQILTSAIPYEGSEVLHELNKRCIYVRDPGLIWDRENAQRIPPSAFLAHTFANKFFFEQHISVDAKGRDKSRLVKVPLAKAWLEWEHRAEARKLTFDPGGEEVTLEGHLNTWSQWGLRAPCKGDVTPWHALLRHIFQFDQKAHQYFERWCAYPLQNPGAKMAVAAVVWGTTQGSGKTLIGETLMRIYGHRHSAELKDGDLEDERCQWAEDCQFVLVDDITSRGDHKAMRKLMTMITQKRMRINPKFITPYTVPDCINYYFTSNDPDALFMESGDRRFFVHETKAGKFDYHDYVKWMRSEEGASALWAYLLELDVGTFDPHEAALMTTGKREMIELGKSDLGAWVLELRENANEMLGRHNMKGDLFTAGELHALYDPNGAKRAGTNALARELKRAGFMPPANGSKLHLSNGAQRMCYAVRNEDKWRKETWSNACKHKNETLLPEKKVKF
jgi:Domain of unknown function (DUF3854)/Family of unknown function (DUF5906)